MWYPGQEQKKEVVIGSECIMGGQAHMPSKNTFIHFAQHFEDDDLNSDINDEDEFCEINTSFKRHLSAPATTLQRQRSSGPSPTSQLGSKPPSSFHMPKRIDSMHSIEAMHTIEAMPTIDSLVSLEDSPVLTTDSGKDDGPTDDEDDGFSSSEPENDTGLWRQETEQCWPTYYAGSDNQVVQIVQQPDGFWPSRGPGSITAPNQVDLAGSKATQRWSDVTDAPAPISPTSFTVGLGKTSSGSETTTQVPANPMMAANAAAEQWPGQQGYYVLVPIPGYAGPSPVQDMSMKPNRRNRRKGNSLIDSAELERQRKVTEQLMSAQTVIDGPSAVSGEQKVFQGNTSNTDTPKFCAGCGGWTEPHFKFCLFCGGPVIKA